MKKRILAAALVLCLLLPGLNFRAFAADTQTTQQNVPIRVSAVVDGVQIRAQDVDGELYLFLPYTADLTALSLYFRKIRTQPDQLCRFLGTEGPSGAQIGNCFQQIGFALGIVTYDQVHTRRKIQIQFPVVPKIPKSNILKHHIRRYGK